MRLYHFSEDGEITSFAPHVPEHRDGDVEAYVWAIDEEHVPMHYVPRDCPRACFCPGDQTSIEDRERWFGGVNARMVMAVESGWLERIRSTALYRYAMPPETFELLDANAGHWGEPGDRGAALGGAGRRPARGDCSRGRRAVHYGAAC